MPVDVKTGSSPLIISIPHAGTKMARAITQRLSASGRRLRDTDWHIDRLHSDLVQDVTVVRARFHRYICDADCNPHENGGLNVAALVPMLDQDGHLIWDHPPDKLEMASWRSAFHAPYHATLATQIARVRARHGFAVLYDCQATRSEVPTLFSGVAPDFGIDTCMGATCDHKLAAHVAGICLDAGEYSSTINTRPRRGWTVQRYGRPGSGVHALQMRLSLATYLTAEAEPWLYDDRKAAPMREVLTEVLTYMKGWQPEHAYSNN